MTISRFLLTFCGYFAFTFCAILKRFSGKHRISELCLSSTSIIVNIMRQHMGKWLLYARENGRIKEKCASLLKLLCLQGPGSNEGGKGELRKEEAEYRMCPFFPG